MSDKMLILLVFAFIFLIPFGILAFLTTGAQGSVARAEMS
jgi:hypothetical protein